MKNLSCNLLLTCDQTILSKDNKISLIGIFDQIFVPSIPTNHPKLSLVGIVIGDAYADHTLTVAITDPTGKKLFPDQNISINLGVTGRSNLVADFINLPITSAGLITFTLLSAKTELSKTILTITQITPPTKNRVIN